MSIDKNKGFFGHPVALSTMFASEMWERFSYYGMRALLVLFLTTTFASGGFAASDHSAIRSLAFGGRLDLGLARSRTHVFSGGPDAHDPDVLFPVAEDATGHIRLLYSSFNRLAFEVVSSASGMFVLTYPYEKNWHATVDDDAAHVYREKG